MAATLVGVVTFGQKRNAHLPALAFTSTWWLRSRSKWNLPLVLANGNCSDLER